MGQRNLPKMGFATPWFSLSQNQTATATCNDMRALGVKVIRVDCWWDWVQPNSSQSYNFDIYGPTYKIFLDAGIDVIPIFHGAAQWMIDAGWMPNVTIRQAYGNYVAAGVNYFKGMGINTYEMWNEPNLSGSWAGYEPNPQNYGQLINGAYAQAKAADPKCHMIGGGLSPALNTNTGDGYYGAKDFTTVAFQNGAAGSCDSWSVHPYAFPYDPNQSDEWLGWNVGKSVIEQLKVLGYGNLPVLYTEYGAATFSNDPNEQGNINTEQDQADIEMDHAFQQFAGQLPSVAQLHWYTYTDYTGYYSREGYFGLVKVPYSQKPAYARWKVWNR